VQPSVWLKHSAILTSNFFSPGEFIFLVFHKTLLKHWKRFFQPITHISPSGIRAHPNRIILVLCSSLGNFYHIRREGRSI
jgi:hypothetical protein